MDVTRREFVCCAAVTAAAVARGGLQRHQSLGATCILLDLGEQCTLPESLAGYRDALAGAKAVAGQVMIVPAALSIGSAAARRIGRHVEEGGSLIFESGAMFVAPATREFCDHRDALRDLLGVEVEPPRSTVRERARVPYVEFRWPSRALVRDFSAIVPVCARDGERIAQVEDTTVAVARRRGRGMIVFLGSPIGPALWAGDVEARHWLDEVLALASPHECLTIQRSQLTASSWLSESDCQVDGYEKTRRACPGP